MTAPVECRACSAGSPIVWHVQSKKYMHLAPGLSVTSCDAIDARTQRAKTSSTTKAASKYAGTSVVLVTTSALSSLSPSSISLGATSCAFKVKIVKA